MGRILDKFKKSNKPFNRKVRIVKSLVTKLTKAGILDPKTLKYTVAH